jgi:hypothetical protein
MGCEDIGLAVTAGRRNDDFELHHECDLLPKRGSSHGSILPFCFRHEPAARIDKMASASALLDRMPRLARPYIICVLPRANNQANAQAGATPPPASQQEAAQYPASGNEQPASAPSGASKVCRTLEQAAAENGLPVEFLPVLFGKRAVSTPLP